MVPEQITTQEINEYKQTILEHSVLLSAKNAAIVLDCSPRKVYDLVRDGELSGYNANYKRRGLRVLASELRDYISSIRVEADNWRE